MPTELHVITPALNYKRQRQLHLQGERRTVDSNVATVAIHRGRTNDAPVAVNDSYNATKTRR